MNFFGFKKPSEVAEPADTVETTSTSPLADTEIFGSEPASHQDETQPDLPSAQALPSSTSGVETVASGDVDASAQTADEALPPDTSETFPDDSEASAAVLASEPPRALFPGTFLGGEYEIKEVISRGVINYYLADAGDYGAHDFKLIGERLAPTLRVETEVEAGFFPPATRWVQDEREYAAWDWQNLKSLEDWQAQPNDETYLHVIGAVARGIFALENAGLAPNLARESLFFDASGELKSFGFFDASETENLASDSSIRQLSALSSRFAKTNLAAGATLRLDDEFGALPFSQEVKAFARALNDGQFASAGEAAAALEDFASIKKTDVALLTDVGMERELNEDCGLVWKTSRAGHARNFELEVLAVADGMGGHEGGEVASDLTLSSLENAITKRADLDFRDNAAVLGTLGEVLAEVNQAVVRLTENPPYASMRAKPGSTLVCALRLGSRLFLGNVGDSRAYRWNAKTGLERLTKDHSYVQDLLDSGSISEDQAWGHPDGSVITSHIGMMRGLKRDVFLRLLRRGDRVVLVSDGVVDTLRDAQIEVIIAAQSEAAELCAALVNAANDAGGFDNITVAAMICA